MSTNLKKLSLLLATTAVISLSASFAQATTTDPCVIGTVVPETGSGVLATRVIDFGNDVIVYKSISSNGGVAMKSFKELSDRAQKRLEAQRKTLPPQCQ